MKQFPSRIEADDRRFHKSPAPRIPYSKFVTPYTDTRSVFGLFPRTAAICGLNYIQRIIDALTFKINQRARRVFLNLHF
jgi:hypothetical protein